LTVDVVDVCALSTLVGLPGATVLIGEPFGARAGGVALSGLGTDRTGVVDASFGLLAPGLLAFFTQEAPAASAVAVFTTQGEYWLVIGAGLAGTPASLVVTAVPVVNTGVEFVVVEDSVPCVVLSLTDTPLTTLRTRV
jgi:hypothetical protein